MAINNSVIERTEEKKRLNSAIHWLIEQTPPHNVQQIEEASQRFDLSPLDEDFLMTQFLQKQASP